MITQFSENTPHLWHLFTTLTRNKHHDYRACKAGDLLEKPGAGDTHIQALALSMLYYSWSSSLRKMQTWLGCYLHTSGAKVHVIDLFQQYGISVSHQSVNGILETLANEQRKKLKEVGADIINKPLNMVYDNINIHEKVAQQRGDSQDKQFNGICGFVTRTSGRSSLLRRDTFIPRQLENIDSYLWAFKSNGICE